MTFPTNEEFRNNHDWTIIKGTGENLDVSNDGEGMFWQFRIAVYPSQENLEKAFNALKSINYLHNPQAHPLLKIINTGNDFSTWDGALCDASDRDQRGKEICVYLPYNSSKSSFVFTQEHIKQMMLDMWKALEDHDVRLSYIAPARDEKAIETDAGIYTPFSYSAFKPYNGPDGILHEEHYNPLNLPDPLEGLHLSLDDLRLAGIQNFHDIAISIQRILYMEKHQRDVIGLLKNKIQQASENQSDLPELLRKLQQNAQQENNEEIQKLLQTIHDRLTQNPEYLPTQLRKNRTSYDGHMNHFVNSENNEAKLSFAKQLVSEVNELVDSTCVHIENMIQSGKYPELTALLPETKEELRHFIAKNAFMMQSFVRQLTHLSHEQEVLIRERKVFDAYPYYQNCWNSIADNDELLKARALLNDYTRNNSSISRFFHGNWNRHHLHEVHQIVRAIDNQEITTLEELLNRLDNIQLANSNGSLARRIAFISANTLPMDTISALETTVDSETLLLIEEDDDDDDKDNIPSL